MAHPVGNAFVSTQLLVLLGAVGIASTLGACARAPAPASDSVAQPTRSAIPPEAPTQTTSTTSAEAAASHEPPVARAPVASTTAPASSSQAGEDCSRFETSPEYRDLPADERARSLATCQAKQEFRAFVATRQSCSTASQCTVVVGSCPFGCFVPVAKASAPEVVAKLDALGARLDQAGNRCVYRCMSPPSEACVAGRCSAGTP